MKRKLVLILLISLAVVALALTVRFVFGGNEDTWIKVNNVWVKHGNPSSPAPK